MLTASLTFFAQTSMKFNETILFNPYSFNPADSRSIRTLATLLGKKYSFFLFFFCLFLKGKACAIRFMELLRVPQLDKIKTS